jgi:hypothetical protein
MTWRWPLLPEPGLERSIDALERRFEPRRVHEAVGSDAHGEALREKLSEEPLRVLLRALDLHRELEDGERAVRDAREHGVEQLAAATRGSRPAA